MHREILKEIREAEEHSGALDKESHERRREILARAQEDARKKALDAERSSQAEADRLIAEVVAAAEEEAGRIAAEADGRIEAVRRDAEAKIAEAVRVSVKKMLG
ncbi:MAG: hypothetical protein V2A58_16450 [Planctomycetota bacterium]